MYGTCVFMDYLPRRVRRQSIVGFSGCDFFDRIYYNKLKARKTAKLYLQPVIIMELQEHGGTNIHPLP